jgi:aspartate ammonia-lyase
MLWVELSVLIACIVVGARLGGISLAKNLIAATSDLHAFAADSSSLRNLAAKLVKVSTDLQFLSSGTAVPRWP